MRRTRAVFLNKSPFSFTYQRKLCSFFGVCSASWAQLSLRENATIPLYDLLTLPVNSNVLNPATQIHAHVIKLGYCDDTFSQNSLIRLYSKGGFLNDGLKIFDEMPERNLVSWTLVISASMQNDELGLGFEVFLGMTRAGLRPNEFALASVIKACCDVGANEFGSCIHCLTLRIGLEKHQYVGSSILGMYAKFGDIEAAEQVFMCIKNPDTGCWNAMIGGYAECGCGFEAAKLVCSMQCRAVPMDNYTFINALKACLVMGGLDLAREIHGLMIRSNLELTTSVLNCLMDLYFKLGRRNSALRVSGFMHKDVISWNTEFSYFCQDENAREVSNLFRKLLSTGLKPNSITFSILLRFCGEALHPDLGLQFFCLALKFGFCEANIVSSIISMFFKNGEAKAARRIFDTTPLKGINSCNEMIFGYTYTCCHLETFRMFNELRELGVKPDEYTFSAMLGGWCDTKDGLIGRQLHGIVIKTGYDTNSFVCSSLIKGYVRFGLLDDSFEFFSGLQMLDLTCWGTMFSELVHLGYNHVVVRLLNHLLESGGRPDEFILGSILGGCADLALHQYTKCMHALVAKLGFETHCFVASAVIDAYGKYGDTESARMVFDQAAVSDDIVIYNSMITSYAHHGLVHEAMEIFDRTKLANLQPSQATFVSVLSACNYHGQVEEGRAIFNMISSHYGMQPSSDNYGCLVDLLSRRGFLGDAKRVIQDMPYPPWPAILRSLLSGCRLYGDRELGKWAADKLSQLAPKDDATYVLLSKVYSEGGSWESAAEVRRGMRREGIQKEQGYSWIGL